MNLGIAGEFRCVVLREDGTVKEDTGYQRNLLLDQGLDYFGGKHGSDISSRLLLGSGNSKPEVSQTLLDSPVAIASRTSTSTDFTYSDKGDGLYRLWQENVYRFSDISNINISELGLASARTSSTSTPLIGDYWLTTRALIKNLSGNPTTITLLDGEILDVYYKIHKVIDVSERAFVIGMTDGDGGSIPYNVKIKGFAVGLSSNTVTQNTSSVNGSGSTSSQARVSSDEWEDITTGTLKTGVPIQNVVSAETYIDRSYKRTYKLSLGLNQGNIPIRSFFSGSYSQFIPFQVRFGSVEDDSPIDKTLSDSFEMKLEVSWSRYLGDL